MTKARWTSLFILTLGMGGCTSSGRYFPAEVSEHQRAWFGEHLHAMHEPALGAPNREANVGVTTFRVLCLPTSGHPVAVRYTVGKDGTTRRAVELTGMGGYAPGRILTDRTTSISRGESMALLTSLDATGFWAMPIEEPWNDIVITDGTMVVIEAVRDDRYHIVVRSDPIVAANERGTKSLFDFYANTIADAGVGSLYDGQMVSCLEERTQQEPGRPLPAMSHEGPISP